MIAAPESSGEISSPWKMSFTAWKDVLVRSWSESTNDNVGLIAAGVAFYAFLALVPLLGAIVLSYGLIADTKTVVHDMQGLTSVMPGDAAKLVGEQLKNVVETSSSTKGLGLLLALSLALFGARSAAGSIITALNIAYEVREKRSFVLVNLLALTMTAGAVLVAVFAVIAIAALGHLEALLPGAPELVIIVGKISSYILLALGGAAGAATLYRFGPSREKAHWVWLTAGSVIATLGWLILTFGFGLYVAHFGNYNATYGSLGAVVVMLTWLYLSSYVLMFGAEINSEFEKQTKAEGLADSTTLARELSGAQASENAREDQIITPPRLAIGGQLAPRVTASDLGTGQLLAAATRIIGLGRVGIATAALSTIALARLRRGRVGQGVAILGSAGLVAWLRRARPDQTGVIGGDAKNGG